MKDYSTRLVLIALTILLLSFVVVNEAPVAAQNPDEFQQPTTVFIASPADGQTVSGIIEVMGAVDFPDFVKYELFLKSGDQLIWGATVYAPVINGLLARLDTKIFADGSYQLLIRQVHSDSNFDDFLGPIITIQNELGAPQPFPEVYSSPLYPPVAGALLRFNQCAGFRTEFDYVSPKGFCSFGNLWVPAKLQDQPLCTSVDILLIPDCEYRGTVSPEDNNARGARYDFLAEPGKIYELNYPGGDFLYLGEVSGDKRLSTDTGGLDIKDPTRYQTPTNAVASTSAQAEPAAEVAAPSTTQQTEPQTTVSSTPEAGDDSGALLPVSGRASESTVHFTVAAIGLLLFMIIGGVVAMRRGKQGAG